VSSDRSGMIACPTPSKLAYTSRREAATFARRATGPQFGGQLRPYLCACERWHLTSMPRRQGRKWRKRDAA